MKPHHLLAIFTFIIPVVSFSQTAEDLYDEGRQLKDEKKSAEAIKKFQAALDLKPGYTEARYEMGWCLNDTKDYTKAISTLRMARVGWPAVPKVWFELGYAFEKTNQNDSAVVCYNKCISLKPDYSLAFKQLGYIDYINENYTSALERLKKFAELKNGTVEDYLFWYRKGFMENAAKDYNASKVSLNNSVKYKTDYINTWLELGFACKNLKENDEAISYYNEAMKIDPKSHIPYNGIGEVYRDNYKDMTKAMEWYQKSLGVKKDERKACFGMGYCYNNLEKYNEAIPYLKKAIEQESTYTAAYTELGYSYYMLKNNSDALINLNKSISLNPNGANPYYYAALVYIQLKDKVKAQEMVNGYKRAGKDATSIQQKVDAL